MDVFDPALDPMAGDVPVDSGVAPELAMFGLVSPGDVRAAKQHDQLFVLDLANAAAAAKAGSNSIPLSLWQAFALWKSSTWDPFYSAADSLLTAQASMSKLKVLESDIASFQSRFSDYVVLGMPLIGAAGGGAPTTAIDVASKGVDTLGKAADAVKWIAILAGVAAIVVVGANVLGVSRGISDAAGHALVRRSNPRRRRRGRRRGRR